MKKSIIIILFALFGLTACTEKMRIDTQDGDRLIGVSASITDEYKKHEVILSYTEDFYGGSPQMISNADVSVLDGILVAHEQNSDEFDTVWLNTISYDESNEPGYYLSSDEFAGQTDHVYRLMIDIYDSNDAKHLYAVSKMNKNVDTIDSIVVKPWKFNELEVKDMLGVYPYFLTTDDPKTYYMARVKINNKDVGGDTLTKCELFETLGFAGNYFNGSFMVAMAGEYPIYGLNQKKPLEVVNVGDTVTMDLWSIPRSYAHYIYEIASNSGTNPMMGTPYNVSTNIYPEGMAVGCFHASSLRQCSVIY